MCSDKILQVKNPHSHTRIKKRQYLFYTFRSLGIDFWIKKIHNTCVVVYQNGFNRNIIDYWYLAFYNAPDNFYSMLISRCFLKHTNSKLLSENKLE